MSLDSTIEIVKDIGLIAASAALVLTITGMYFENKKYQRFKELMIRAIKNERINMIEDTYRQEK